MPRTPEPTSLLEAPPVLAPADAGDLRARVDAALVAFLDGQAPTLEAVGPDNIVLSPQSMGGEDFGWFADVLPIALARLGTHGGGPPLDLHRGMFDVDERAIGVGVRLLARSALHALDADAHPPKT